MMISFEVKIIRTEIRKKKILMPTIVKLKTIRKKC